MSPEQQPMEYPEAKEHCLALAEEAGRLSARAWASEDAQAIRSLVAWAEEADETIKMLSGQLADKREIIRKLVS